MAEEGKPIADEAHLQRQDLKDTQGGHTLALDPRGGIEDCCAVLLTEMCSHKVGMCRDSWSLALGG